MERTSEYIKCSERLPEEYGPYKVIRRGMHGRPSYEDECWFTPKRGGHDAFWTNARGVRVTTVEAWRDDRA